MTASCSVTIAAEVTELGAELSVRQKFTTLSTPTAVTKQYRTLTTADTPEMLALGDVAVSVADGIWFKATGDEFWIDTTVSTGGTASDFVRELHVPDGKSAWFSPPQGTTSIAVLASTAAAFEYMVIGKTS